MNRGIPEDLGRILETDEKILYIGKPEFRPFVLKNLAGAILPSIFIVWFLSFFIGFRIPLILPVILFLIFFLGVLGFIVAAAIFYPLLVWRNIIYLVTNKRVIIRKGVIGIDYDILSLEYIQQVKVDRGVWDKIYNTGTLIINAIGVPPVKLYSIREFFEVEKMINKIVREFKKML